MELVYLWVEEYKNIHKQGFNFSPKFNCNYDPNTNELTIDENDKYIENFFGDNINVTAIVGKNGSGKSSVLQALTNRDNYYSFFDSHSEEISKDKFFDRNIILLYDEDIESENYLNEFNINQQAKTNLNIDSKYILNNISVSFLFNNNQEFLKNFKFIPTHIELGRIVEVQDDDFKNLLKKQYTFVNDMMDTNQIFTIDSQDINDFKKFIENELSQLSDEIESVRNYLYLREFIYKVNNSHSKAYDIAETIIKHNKFNYLDDVNSFFQRELEELFSMNEDIFNEIIENIEYSQIRSISCLHKIIIDINNENIEKLLSNIHRDFFSIKFFKKTKTKNIYLNNLSNGERKLILLFANIFYIIRKLYATEEEKSFYILLDEPDIYLHPEWQKKLIKLFHLFLSSNEIFETKKFNIIFTSHSPFLLSDIPKQNIIFLDKDENGNCKVVDGLKEKKQTFGANIHTLLSDSFFMEDGLMGEFAKNKIQQIMNILNGKPSSYAYQFRYIFTNEYNFTLMSKNIKKVIETIGEPFLKDKLLKMHDEKYPKTDADKIQELEAEIERIRSAKN